MLQVFVNNFTADESGMDYKGDDKGYDYPDVAYIIIFSVIGIAAFEVVFWIGYFSA